MKIIVVGLGIQGKKRVSIAGQECVGTVDPVNPEAHYKNLTDVPLNDYEAVCLCTPDEAKEELLEYCLKQGKHVLVEKPLISLAPEKIQALAKLAKQQGVSCYTAYNHRFEPHFQRMKQVLDENSLGKIYSCRLFYGNGTARDVQNSPWRDKGLGVLADLGSHLLDTLLYWFGPKHYSLQTVAKHTFENKSLDHVVLQAEDEIYLNLEMSLLSFRNHFTCDIVAEKGSVHIDSLCKWGPSSFIKRLRLLPSGRPPEETTVLVQKDPTWQLEYGYFKELCQSGENNLENDYLINKMLQEL